MPTGGLDQGTVQAVTVNPHVSLPMNLRLPRGHTPWVAVENVAVDATEPDRV
ncbi:hypothetical protein RHCRD62_20577 [Rhodococcus sp. RD6.2]|nr:hypothetical protein RHCRD62_20577 [Rhodococcus sp. RD6.2]